MIKFLPVQTKLDRQVIEFGEQISAAYRSEGTSERAILDYGFVSGVEWVFLTLHEYIGDAEISPDAWELLGKLDSEMAIRMTAESGPAKVT